MAKRDPVKRYNDIMYDMCLDHLAIGELHTGTKGWNLRDMVSEMQYQLDMLNDPDCLPYMDAHAEEQPPHKPWLKEWNAQRMKCKRFIDAYKDQIVDMVCVEGHCSIYD